jgi:hypothetical protein
LTYRVRGQVLLRITRSTIHFIPGNHTSIARHILSAFLTYSHKSQTIARFSAAANESGRFRPLSQGGLAPGILPWPSPQQSTVSGITGVPKSDSYFHLHLVSDATGETLLAVGRAAAAQYSTVSPIEHVYPLIRNVKQLDPVLTDIEANPGIVLYTLVDPVLTDRLENHCKERSIPCLSILEPGSKSFRLLSRNRNDPAGRRPAHAECRLFPADRRAELHAVHDDGQHPENLDDADVVLSAFPAPRKPRPASISPTAASRPRTSRWCLASIPRANWNG